MKNFFSQSCPRLFLLCAVVCVSTACEQGAVLVSAIKGPEKIEPLYDLEDVPTLIMVDDPKHLLNNPGLARQIATTAIHYLKFHEALPNATFIEPKELAKLEAEFGDRWASTPIDEIGRRLGAEQVVHATIKSAQFHVADTLYRPEASIEVKVINVTDGRRAWPEASILADPQRMPPGYLIQIKENYQSRDSRYIGDSTPDDLARRMADEAGLRLARLFYSWQPDGPGSTL